MPKKNMHSWLLWNIRLLGYQDYFKGYLYLNLWWKIAKVVYEKLLMLPALMAMVL